MAPTSRSPLTSDMHRRLVAERASIERCYELLSLRLRDETAKSTAAAVRREFEQVNGLHRKVELLTVELQEARDQNELLEFRILELEGCQSQTMAAPVFLVEDFVRSTRDAETELELPCADCYNLESNLAAIRAENNGLMEKLHNSDERNEVLTKENMQLRLDCASLKEQLALLVSSRPEEMTGVDQTTGKGIKREASPSTSDLSHEKKRSGSGQADNHSEHSFFTSEDEGLGDLARSDGSGPSSLAHESEDELVVDSSSASSTSGSTRSHSAASPTDSAKSFASDGSNLFLDCATQTDDLSETSCIVGGEEERRMSQQIGDGTGEENEISESQVELLHVDDARSSVVETTDSITEDAARPGSASSSAAECATERSDQKEVENAVLLLVASAARDADALEKLRLEEVISKLSQEKAALEEQVLELEEAENDARLASQRLQAQLEGLLGQIEANEQRFEKQIDAYRASLSKESGDQVTTSSSSGTAANLAGASDNEKENGDPDASRQSSACSAPHGWRHARDALDRGHVLSDNSSDEDDEMELFIPQEDMAVSGSSFDTSSMRRGNSAKRESYEPSTEAEDRPDESMVLRLPLCETVKPKKIDVLMCSPGGSPRPATEYKPPANTQMTSSPTTNTSTGNLTPPELSERLAQLSRNEQMLRERLLELEWINKEFVRELEVRERLFIERQAANKEFHESEEVLNKEMHQLQLELAEMQNAIEEMRNQHLELQQTLQKECALHDSLKSAEASKEKPRNVSRIVVKLGDSDDHNSHLSKQFERRSSLVEFFQARESSAVSDQQDKVRQLQSREEDLSERLRSVHESEADLRERISSKNDQLLSLRSAYGEKLTSLDEEHEAVARELQTKMKEMEAKSAITVKQLEDERSDIRNAFEEAIKQLVSKESRFQAKIVSVEENLKDVVASQRTTENELQTLRKSLDDERTSSAGLRAQIKEMEGKEVAYKETLAKADAIVASMEKGYKERIDDLENSERELKNRVCQLEETENRLLTNLRSERRTSESRKTSDLVQEIIDAEARECVLRETICKLEDIERNLRDRNRLLESDKRELERELEEHDTLISTVVALQEQIEKLKKDLAKAIGEQEGVQRLLQDTERFYAEREKQYETKIKHLHQDTCALRSQLDDHRRRRCEEEDEMNDRQLASGLANGIRGQCNLKRRESTGSFFSEELDRLRVSHDNEDETSRDALEEPQSLVRRAVNSLEKKLRREKPAPAPQRSASADERAFSSLESSSLANSSNLSSFAEHNDCDLKAKVQPERK